MAKKKDKSQYIVKGTITNQDDKPVAGLLVYAFDQDPNTPDNLLGQPAPTNEDGKYKISFTAKDFQVPKESGGPDVFIRVYAGEKVLGESLVERNASEKTTRNLKVEVKVKTYILAGGVYTSKRLGAPGMKVQVLDKHIEGDRLLGTPTTDHRGQFNLEFNFPELVKDPPDLQLLAIDTKDPKNVLGRSEVRYDITTKERIDLVLPLANDSVRPNEFEELKANLSKYLKSVPFKALQENDEKSDITFLAGKTGVDARLIGMMVLAHEYGEKNDLPAEVYYALFRAGQPTEEARINRTHSKTLRGILKLAVKNNVIGKEHEARIPEFVRKFENTAVTYTLQDKGSGGLFTMEEFLEMTFEGDVVDKQAFAKIYHEHNNKPEEFWTKVKDKFGEKKAEKARTDGKLGFLTLNNRLLVEKLRKKGNLKISKPAQKGILKGIKKLFSKKVTSVEDPLALVYNGLFTVDRWKALLTKDIPIPDNVTGTNEDEKRQNYAKMMAAQVRLSYPSAVLAQQIATGEFKLSESKKVKEGITRFLLQEHGGFTIGKTPVAKYVIDNKVLLETTPDQQAAVLKALKRIERVYQMSPSDQAMRVLLNNNLDSAFLVADRYDEDTFIKEFAGVMGGENVARMTYAKSTMIAGAVMNVAMAYGSHRRNPSIYSINAGHHLHKDVPGADDSIIYPTLEESFGEMDYCECEHCRSILSPAAYFVDLLKFIDRNVNLGGGENPYEVLRSRRPDLEYIALTCENTNTVLPYIDLVNEILEYFVVNGNLNGFKGYNVEEDEESADLLANPKFVLDQAYQTLQDEVYPMKLPFNYFLETSRAYFDHMKIPLWKAMKHFRSGDTMTSPADPDDPKDPQAPYGWKEIYNEFLGLSPQLHGILTSNTKKLEEYYGEDAGTDLNTFLSKTNENGKKEYSKRLTRKLGISYKDLVAIVKTQFFNPHAHLIKKLEKLEAGLPTIIDYINSDGTNDLQLPPDLDESKYDGDAKAWLLKQDSTRGINNPVQIRNLIFLTDSAENTDDCNFASLQLRYADGRVLRPIEYWKLLKFIRLWKALGWTIEQTDLALASLYDQAQIPKPEDTDDKAVSKLSQGFKTFLVRLAQAKETMELLQMNVKRDLGRVMAFWSDISTYGQSSLYSQLFLNPAIRKIDTVFEPDSYGGYLQDNTQTLSSHVPAIMAVLNLKKEAYQILVSELGLLDELTFGNLSQLFRYATLSRALRISVQELLTIRNLSGIDDLFGGLGTVPNPTLRFIEIVNMIKNTGFKIPKLNYLLTHEDLSGNASPPLRDILSFAKSVRAELLAIEQDNQESPEDPNGEIARAKLSQTFGQGVADRFFGLIERTVISSTAYDHSTENLGVTIKAVNSRLQYEDVEKILSFDGVMSEEEKSAYLALAGTTQDFKDTISRLHKAQGSMKISYDHGGATLSTEMLGVSSHLMYDDFAKQLSFQGAMSRTEQASLTSLGISAEFNKAIDKLFDQSQTLFDQLPELGKLYQAHFEVKSIVSRRASFSGILSWISPIVKPRLKRVALRELIGSSLRSDSELLALLLESPWIIHSEGDQSMALIEDYYTIENNDRFSTDSLVAGLLRLRTFIDPSTTDFFNLYVETDATNVTVQIKEEAIAGTLRNGVWTNDDSIALKAGELVTLEITLEETANQPTIKWATKTMGKTEIPVEHLYSFGSIATFKRAYLRLLKSLAFVEALSFSPQEVLHFSRFAIDIEGIQKNINWFNAIRCPDQSTPATTQQVFSHLTQLFTYNQFKEKVKVQGDILIAALKDPWAVNENDENLLLMITGWQSVDRDALLERFDWSLTELSNPIQLMHFGKAHDILVQTGLSAAILSKIVTVTPKSEHLSELQAGLRIKYDTNSWRDVIQPINDRLRTAQRDALVSYVLHQLSKDSATRHLNTPEKLFEHLLIDVEMDACMETSRIKQAISTVQLFIHRCFLNLEKKVSPSTLNTKQWDWMKRYRVWEANRKVFLWPENWLEPELRDNKSSFFKELEGELLQSDITEESAATAFLNYLEKLDNVAKLQICGMFIQENTIKEQDLYYSADDIVHVFGMTPGANRKYYYQRLKSGYWTPWEKIDLDIEDTPLLPVVWKDRLFLFWLNLMPEGEKNTKSTIKKGENDDLLINAKIETSPEAPKVKTMATLSWSEYINGKWQPRRTSDYKNPFELFDEAVVRKTLQMSSREWGDELLEVSTEGTSLAFHHKNSIPIEIDYTPFIIEIFYREFKDFDYYEPKLEVECFENKFDEDSPTRTSIFNHKILDNVPKDSGLHEASHPVEGHPWEVPLFMQNSRHVFYLSPKETYYTIPIFQGFGTFTPSPPVIVPTVPVFWEKPDIQISTKPIDPLEPINKPSPTSSGKISLDDNEAQLAERLIAGNIRQAILNGQPINFRGVQLGTKGILAPTPRG